MVQCAASHPTQAQEQLWSNEQCHTPHRHRSIWDPMCNSSSWRKLCPQHGWESKAEKGGNAKAVFTFSQSRKGKIARTRQDTIKQISSQYFRKIFSICLHCQIPRSYEVCQLPSFFSPFHPPFLLQSGVSLNIAEVDFTIYENEVKFHSIGK